jgi:hypothetical protein
LDPSGSGTYVTKGMGLASLRNGVPVSASRRRAGSKASLIASPHDSARVVDLVEDDQRAPVLGALPVQRRMRRHLRVGDGHPLEVGAGPALRVPVRRVDGEPEPRRRLRPLVLEVLGRRDHRNGRDLAQREQLGGHGERVRGLARARRRHQQEVTPSNAEILFVSSLLPATEKIKSIIPNVRGRLPSPTHSAPLSSPDGSDS